MGDRPDDAPRSDEATALVPLSASDWFGLAGWKLFVSLVVLATGFVGVSDDDFARVVIAQEFVHAPRLDPSGTSWLPLPFWVNGIVMGLTLPTIEVARALAVVLGVASVLLVAWSGRALGLDRSSARLGAAIAAVLPWSARLGVSAVPELPTAACSLAAIASLAVRDDARMRLLGGGLLLAACLSRYEPWFLAAGFAALTVLDLARGSFGATRDKARAAAAIGLALGGPAAWSIWNAHAHGSATHYLDRVAAYKQAIDQGATLERATSYVLATFRAEPELVLGLALVGFALARGRGRAELAAWSRFARPAAVLAFLFATLTVSSLRGGAPTHHPERALLALHLLGAVALGHAWTRARRLERLGRPRHWLVLAVVLGPGLYVTRFWFLYREHFASRRDEVAIGEAVLQRVPLEARVLVEAVDYGHFAVQAGSTRPWTFELSGPIVPGKGGSPIAPEVLAALADERGARYVVARAHTPAPLGLTSLVNRGNHTLYAREAPR